MDDKPLEPHDFVWRLPYVYNGPVIKAAWMPVPLRFAGRPLSEWAVLVFAFFFTFKIASAVATVVFASPGPQWVFKIGVGWFAASAIARWVYREAIDADRSIPFLALFAWSEARRWARARGPVDPWAAVATAPVLLSFSRVAALVLPLPRLALFALVYIPARWVGRHLVAAYESPERRFQRVAARHARSCSSTTSPLSASVPT